MRFIIKHMTLDSRQLNRIIDLLHEKQFLTKTVSNKRLKIQRRKVIANDVSDRFGMFRLIQVKGEIEFGLSQSAVNISFVKYLILTALSLLVPMLLLYYIKNVSPLNLVIVYVLLCLLWYLYVRVTIKKVITSCFQRKIY